MLCPGAVSKTRNFLCIVASSYRSRHLVGDAVPVAGAQMADITIHDVLAWEPRLQLMRRPLPGATSSEDVNQRDVSWAVTVRSSAPMLGPLRGGELVLLPDRVLAESGLALSVLLRELGSHNVGAAILETPPTVASTVPILIAPEVTPDFESSLNRLLTERRGELYRAGTELGRMLAVAGVSSDLGGLVRLASHFLLCSITVMDTRGNVLERNGADSLPAGAARAAQAMIADREWRDNRLLVKLAGGDVLWFGPVARDQQALVRLAADRVSIAIESALHRSADERPRGAARSTALNAVLLGSEDDASRTAPLLGLSTEGRYRVALAPQATDSAALLRAANSIGFGYEAGELGPVQVVIMHLRSEPPESKRGTSRSTARSVSPAFAGVESDWIVLSGEVTGVGSLPTGLRQARYMALLIEHGILPPGVLQFDRLPDIGVYRLLYDVWGSAGLRSYIDDALGDLRKRDRRGTFAATLLAYLNTGGSHVETAALLGIHRNTLAYRLRQIGQLIGRDPDDPTMRLTMHLALVASSLPPADSLGR